MVVRNTILECIREAVEEHGRSMLPGEITDDTPLVAFRLDSLGFAALLARLEEVLGYDPFALMDEFVFPATFGEFVALYTDIEQHASK